MKKVLLGGIKFYQQAISPYKRQCCRFYPTCSAYAIQAITRFGAMKGGWLALKRILRCNPLCKGGVDPVPETYHYFEKFRGERKN